MLGPNSRVWLIVTAGTLLAATVVTWLILGDSSPFYNYFLYNVELPNRWRTVLLVPGLLSFVIGGHSGSEVVLLVAFAIQWIIVGTVLSFIVIAIRRT